jgi:uncharacterized hydrophobic protein (TIGR00271 family)
VSRTIDISLPSEKANALIEDLRSANGVVGFSVHRGASMKPPGDVVTIQTTNEGFLELLGLLSGHDIGNETSIVTSEPRSLVSATSQKQIDQETNEASWPEMAALMRRDTNITTNYLLAMFFAGFVAACGLLADTLHIVIGAMLMAPGFEPLIRVPFGFLARERDSWLQGLTSTVVGYAVLIVGGALGLAAMSLLGQVEPELTDHEWIAYWSNVDPSAFPIALAAGAVGAVIVAAHRSVLTTGVMIALALIPSAAIIGMAIVVGDFGLAAVGLMRWSVDAACVAVAGGLVFLVKRLTSHRLEGQSRSSAQL